MEFKGTKGKWNHIKSYDHHIEVNGKTLVTIHCHEGGKPKYDGRLISKAPEMLKALQEVCNWIDNSDAWWLGCPDKGGFDKEKIEQLIKEATI